MAIVRSQAVLGPLKSLLQCGNVSALTDGQLLERFQNGRGAMAEAAFEALVDRHGAMVLGVCRRILVDLHDADDAFQATFLILVQRAHKVCVDDSLGRWLHGVSYRVALGPNPRPRGENSSKNEPRPIRTLRSSNDLETLDLRGVLDEELGRLPEKYRARLDPLPPARLESERDGPGTWMAPGDRPREARTGSGNLAGTRLSATRHDSVGRVLDPRSVRSGLLRGRSRQRSDTEPFRLS